MTVIPDDKAAPYPWMDDSSDEVGDCHTASVQNPAPSNGGGEASGHGNPEEIQLLSDSD